MHFTAFDILLGQIFIICHSAFTFCYFQGIPDVSDNCPTTSNLGQDNTGDSDSVGDACDNCRNVDNDDQLDSNDNWFGDLCDAVGATNMDE